MYCNSINTFPNHTEILLGCRKIKGYELRNNRKRRTERSMNEYPKIIKYTKGYAVNEEARTEEIDLDEFSFEIAYMVSEVLEKEEIAVEIVFTDKVLPTIQGSRQRLKDIFSEILKICVKEVKRKTTLQLSVRKEKGRCIYEFAYRNKEKIDMCDKRMEELESYIMRFQGNLSIRRIKNTQTKICVTL